MTAIIERPLRDQLRVEILDPETQFVLGASLLDAAELGDGSSVSSWIDYADSATGVSIRRGGQLGDGLAVAMSPGLSAITLYGYTEADPLAPVFVANRRLRILQNTLAGEHELFAGVVRDVELTYQLPRAGGPHVPITTVTVVDAVAEHDQVQRAGALPAGGAETFAQRIRRLSASATAPIEQPAVPTYYAGGNEILLGRTVLEASLSEHLTLACSTVGALWFVAGDGVTRFVPRRGGGADETPDAVIWFNGHPDDKPAGALHGISGEIVAGARSTFTVGIARNLSAVEDPENPGTWAADETELVYRDLPAGAGVQLGRSPVTTTINAADPHTHRLADLQLRYTSGSEMVSTLTWNAQEDLSRIPDLEIGNTLHLHHPVRGLQRAQIVGISHTITASRWMVQLTLIGGAFYDV